MAALRLRSFVHILARPPPISTT